MGSKSSRTSELIKAITAPLGFYVLALLIVEAFMATVGPSSGYPMMGMWIGVGLFVFVTVIVTLLVWVKPENLTFDQYAHLEVRQSSAAYANPASTSSTLMKFWKPDGKTVDADNEERLSAWMASNSLEDVSITSFIRTTKYREEQQEAMKDLDLCFEEREDH